MESNGGELLSPPFALSVGIGTTVVEQEYEINKYIKAKKEEVIEDSVK